MMKKRFALVLTILLAATAAFAADPSILKPPPGHNIAVVVFEDLQCPSCAASDPELISAEKNYKVAIVRHDFPIPSHTWSMEAHVIARYFDTVSPQLGEDYRRYIFANQSSIYKSNLRGMTDKFAAAHNTTLPAFYDPSGALRAKVNADAQLGQSLGIRQTPTIYVVSNSPQKPYIEVTDRSQLFSTIEQMQQFVKASAPAATTPKKKAAAKK